jgi:hypothetical protein
MAGEDPGSVDPATEAAIAEWNARYGNAVGSQGAAAAQAAAAQQAGALFGLPLYNGKLKPGEGYLTVPAGHARYNENVTNAFKPGALMPAWAQQQAPANWLSPQFNARAYFPGISNVVGGDRSEIGPGTNLGFGTMFGSLAPTPSGSGSVNLGVPGTGETLPGRPSRTGGTSIVVSPPGTPRNPYSTPSYYTAAGNGGETRLPLGGLPETPPATPPAAPPPAPFPMPQEGRNAAGTTTAAQATGMIKFVNGEPTVVPIPAQYANMAIPWQYAGRPLPVGAFTSLWTNSQGTDWSKVRPQGV